MKRIGIIGGAGPEAGALLFMNIIRIYQQQGAWQDSDFPWITLLNVPFPPMLSSEDALDNSIQLRTSIQEAVMYLKQQSIDIVVIACNTLHTVVQDIDFMDMEFIHIAIATRKLIPPTCEKILFLGTETSAQAQLYKISRLNLTYPTPEHQQQIDQIIAAILRNTYQQSDTDKLSAIINNYDVDGAILGCTELPILHQKYPLKTSKMIFDTINALAKACTET